MQSIKTQTNGESFFATPAGLLLACLGACLLWGSAFPCVKIGYAMFGIQASDVASIITFAGARFLIAGALVVVTMSLVRRRAYVPHGREEWLCAIKLSSFQTILQYALFYIGMSRSSGVTASIIEASNTFFVVLFAATMFHTERLTGRKMLGCLVGFIGVVLVNLGGATGGATFTLAGEGVVFLSTIAPAISSNLAKKYSLEHDPVLLSGWQFVIGGAVMLAAGLAAGGHFAPVDAANPAPAIALLVYMGFISAAAYSLWSLALAHNPASKVAVFGFMNPVFGAILSAMLLGEAAVVNPVLAVVALVLVSLGIVVVNRPSPDEAADR